MLYYILYYIIYSISILLIFINRYTNIKLAFVAVGNTEIRFLITYAANKYF